MFQLLLNQYTTIKNYIKGHLPTCISQYINGPRDLCFPISNMVRMEWILHFGPHCNKGSGLSHLSLCPRVWCTCRTHSWGTPSPSCWRWCPSPPAYDHCRYVCTAAHYILPRSGENESETKHREMKVNSFKEKWKLTTKRLFCEGEKNCPENTVILPFMLMQQKVLRNWKHSLTYI